MIHFDRLTNKNKNDKNGLLKQDTTKSFIITFHEKHTISTNTKIEDKNLTQLSRSTIQITMDNQPQPQPVQYARCEHCKHIGRRGNLCKECERNREVTTSPRHTKDITVIYRQDLFDLKIIRESYSYDGNCMACYRKGYQGRWCMVCNQEIVSLTTVNDDVVDPYFVATYYKQYDRDTVVIPDNRLRGRHEDMWESTLDRMYAAYTSSSRDTLEPTAATRGKNGLVPADVIESESDHEDDDEELYGENVPNNGDQPMEMDDEPPVASRPYYHQRPKPNFGSDEYILEVIIDAADIEPAEYDLPEYDPSEIEVVDWSEDNEPPEPYHPLDANEFNETMYRRLKAMTIGNLIRYHRE